jgi:hypothetical protein
VLVDDGDYNFGFHTDEEDRPWWRADLNRPYPLSYIVVYNRRDGFQEKARTLLVECSVDGREWLTIHSGVIYFGDGVNAPPFVLPLQGKLWAKHLRLSLQERNYFHLSKIEIWVANGVLRADEVAKDHDLTIPLLGQPGAEETPGYVAVAASSEDLAGPLIGLQVNANGAFGNSVIQYANVADLAKALGLKYVQVAPGGLLDVEIPIVLDGVTFLPADAPLPVGGCFLSGYFFCRHFFPPIAENTTAEGYHRTIQQIVKPLYSVVGRSAQNVSSQDLFVIHVRSGDIFSSWVHPDYVQPPLSFYKLAIRTLRESGAITRVKLVFENRLNPIIDPLERWILDEGIEVSSQSGTLVEDLGAMIDARHLAFGIGTLGTAVCHFSTHIENVWHFAPDQNSPYASIPSIRKVHNVWDRDRKYIRVGTWRNTPEQREMMVDYPEDSLAVY